MIRSLPPLAASTTAFFLLGGLLVWVVVRLLRSNREQLLASGPMTAEQEFALREAAALLLLIEVPRFGSGFRELEFEVVERASGGATKLTYDFVRAQGDKIDLSTIDADTDGTAGNQVFAFIGTGAFTGVDGQLRCSAGVIQGDVNGDKVADFEIKVNLATLITGDFVL